MKNPLVASTPLSVYSTDHLSRCTPTWGIHIPAGGRARSLSNDPPAQVIARPGSSPGTASTVGISRIDGGYLCAKHTIETTITVDLRAEEPTVIVDIG